MPGASVCQAVVASAPVFEINGLKREELIAMNSMILHEAYFDSLGGGGAGLDAPDGQALCRWSRRR